MVKPEIKYVLKSKYKEITFNEKVNKLTYLLPLFF
jgi:hypothetical protein